MQLGHRRARLMKIVRTIAATVYWVVVGTTDCRLRSSLVKQPPPTGENEFREDGPLLVCDRPTSAA
jgi:hypothetical protein